MATPPLHKTRRKKGFEGKHGERSKGAKPGQARQRHFTHHNGSSHGNPVCGSPDPPTYNPRFHSLLWLSRRGGGVGLTSAVLHTKLLSWDCVGSILGFSSCLSGYYFWLSGPSVSPPFFEPDYQTFVSNLLIRDCSKIAALSSFHTFAPLLFNPRFFICMLRMHIILIYCLFIFFLRVRSHSGFCFAIFECFSSLFS